MTDKIFCAIDTTDLNEALSWVEDINSYIYGIKLGMEFFYTHGHTGVQRILEVTNNDSLLFLDLKFYDIPNTVAGAVRSVQPLNPDFLTVHALGGSDMIKSAVDASNDSKILAVTILTSMSENNLIDIGIKDKIQSEVCRLAELALKAGASGLVCSPHEIEILRKEFGQDFTLMVPGIRPKTNNLINDDQNRVMCPKDALDLGASYLVIGRPITKAENPTKAALSLVEEISSCIAAA